MAIRAITRTGLYPYRYPTQVIPMASWTIWTLDARLGASRWLGVGGEALMMRRLENLVPFRAPGFESPPLRSESQERLSRAGQVGRFRVFGRVRGQSGPNATTLTAQTHGITRRLRRLSRCGWGSALRNLQYLPNYCAISRILGPP